MASSITTLLSQYGLLCKLSSFISSADLVHLSATSKANRASLTDSNKIWEQLFANTVCDGKGGAQQMSAFDIKNHQTRKYLETETRPCNSCGKQVCDSCRFHIVYDGDRYSSKKRDEFEAWAERSLYGDDQDQKEEPLTRAADLFAWHYRNYCRKCRPTDTNLQRCACDLYDYFVAGRWLCVPCFLREEEQVGSVVIVCGCNKDTTEDVFPRCKACDGIRLW